MLNWTTPAQESLKRHLDIARRHATSTGADPDEVEADIRRHIETELRNVSTVVTQMDVDAVLHRIGISNPHAELPADSRLSSYDHFFSPARALGNGLPLSDWLFLSLGWLFGVITPVATVVFEMGTGICREFFADPIPTWLHVVLILLVPSANAAGLLSSQRTSPRRLKWLLHANAIALGIGLVYALAFLPLTPFAAIGVILYGLGFLPLSPLTSLIVALRLRKRLRLLGESASLTPPRWWPRAAQAALLLLALEIPPLLTHRAIQLTHANPQATGWHLAWLRTMPWSEDFHVEGRGEDRFLVGHTAGTKLADALWSPLDARAVSIARYRALGLETAPRPRKTFFDNMSSWDWQQGTDQVGKILPTLTLKESTLDGVVDAKAAHGYLEWTFVFRNDHNSWNAEARCQLALPSGGTVSRLTLWIDGEPREAAFGGRSAVKQAYQKVVQVLRRDPALVTMSGPDRALLQCFPILPRGGEMKVRLGITYPLQIDVGDASHGRFVLPHFIERNFSIPETFPHKVWLESWSPLHATSPALKSGSGQQAGSYALRGSLEGVALENPNLGIALERPDEATFAWTEGLVDGEFYTQEIRRQSQPSRQFALVVDGSATLRIHRAALCTALRSVPESVIQQVWFAGDTLVSCPENKASRIADWLERQSFVGGQDSTDALVRAAEYLLAQNEPGYLMWVHGPQTETWQNAGALHQLLERRLGQIHIIEAALATGPNHLIPATPNPLSWSALPRTDTLANDLASAFRRSEADVRWQTIRKRLGAEKTELGIVLGANTRTTDHLRRLAVLDEVNALYSHDKIDEAGALAARHQLVTAVSGAVVLETKKQYDEAGLKPSTGNPAVPEPATYAILAAIFLVALTAHRVKARRA